MFFKFIFRIFMHFVGVGEGGGTKEGAGERGNFREGKLCIS